LALILHGLREKTSISESWLVPYLARFRRHPLQFTGALFMKQSMKLFAINTGYQLGLLPRHGSDPLRVEVTTMQVSRAERQACLLQQEFVSSETPLPLNS